MITVKIISTKAGEGKTVLSGLLETIMNKLEISNRVYCGVTDPDSFVNYDLIEIDTERNITPQKMIDLHEKLKELL